MGRTGRRTPHSEGASAGAQVAGGDALPEGRIDRFVIRGRIGRGGMGEVFRAWDPKLLRDVALKRLPARRPGEEEGRARILAEARAACALSHPAVVRIYDVVEHRGESLIVQEFIEGARLRERMGRPFDLESFFRIAAPCAEALAAASRAGIVHCDLKPENILIEKDGRPRILDFGLARRLWIESAPRGAPADPTSPDPEARRGGTPAYIAPEVVAGREPDEKADIFSFGVVCYEMLTGVNPFARPTVEETLRSIANDRARAPSRANPEVPQDLDRLIERMLEKRPERRFEDTELLVDDLRRIESRLLAPGAGGGAGGTTLPVPGERRTLLCVETFPGAGDAEDPPAMAAGMSEAIRSRVSRILGIDLLDSERDAGASLVVRGALRVRAGKVRVDHELFDRRSGRTADSASLEAPSGELVALRDRVCDSIVGMLARRLGQRGATPPPDRGSAAPAIPSAYDLYIRGKVYLRQAKDNRDVSAAIDLFEKARRLDPGLAEAAAGLGEAYSMRYVLTRDPRWAGEAETSAMAAFGLSPENPEVRIAAGRIYLESGKPDHAVAAYGRALERDPWNYAARVGLARALEAAGRAGEAEKAFVEAVGIHPEHWLGHNLLGAYYLRRGRTRDALRCFLNVVDLAPDYARGYSNLGVAYQTLGRIDEAIDAYRRSAEVAPNYPALSNLATLCRSQGRFEEAVRCFEQALAIDDHDYRVWGNLGSAYLFMENRKPDADRALRRAVELAERQREINPSDPLVLAHLGQYYGQLDQPIAAIRLTERALALEPDRVDVLLAAAALFDQIGEREDARRTLLKALRLGCAPEALAGEPAFRPFLSDPEIATLISMIGGGQE